MPIRNGIARTHSASYAALTRRLADELRRPQDEGEPLIYLEPDSARPTRVVVVWDDWRDLDAEERSRIILDAFREARGESAMLDIVVALGITKSEAERMRIPAA